MTTISCGSFSYSHPFIQKTWTFARCLAILLLVTISLRIAQAPANARSGVQSTSQATAQNQAPEAKPQVNEGTPLFKAETRQVLVDVVITDGRRHFIPGLKSDDFAVVEDGKPQKISAFDVHSQTTSEKPAPPIQLPPHQYSNYQIADPARPVTIILMDVLNTGTQDQANTKKRMIEFLRELPPGQRVGLFALSTRLQTIQGFTGDSDTLVNAAKMLLRNSSPLTSGEQDRQTSEITASNEEVNNGAARGLLKNMLRTLANEQVYQQLQRMDLTLAALQSLARAVSAYPGRKNLLWLSAEFPLRLSPSLLPINSASDQAQNGLEASRRVNALKTRASQVQETAALMTASQIAVYPIDIRGTISTGTGIDISSPNVSGTPGRFEDIRKYTAQRQTTMRWDDHEAMTDIARETGGQAFYGSNDLKAALSRSMEDGSNYYTISYTPENHDWNGKYRKIEVKCAQGGTKLTYRRGYYAFAESSLAANGKPVDDQVALLFATAMHPEAPTSTMVLLKVQALPPDATHKSVRIDYAINPHDVTFLDTEENAKRVMLDLMAVAWDKDGTAKGQDSGKIDATVPLNVYEDVMRSYISAHQELDVKAGTYTLRLGVVDRTSRRIGTLDVPLTIPNSQGPTK